MSDLYEKARSLIVATVPEILRRKELFDKYEEPYGAEDSIRLADVLRAIGKKYQDEKTIVVDLTGIFSEYKSQGKEMGLWCISKGYSWNFEKDDLSQQSPETLSFLISLLEK